MAISERGEPGGAGGGWGTPPGHPDVRTFLGVPLFVGPRVGLRDLHFGLRHMREQVLGIGGSSEVANGDEGDLTLKAGVPLGRAAGP
jgi:hypothetical protein